MKIKYTDNHGWPHEVTIPGGMTEVSGGWLSETQGVRLETVVSLVVPPGMQVTGVPERVSITYLAADEPAEEGGGASKEAQAKSKGAVPGVGGAVHEKERLFKYTDDTDEHCIELPVSLTTITQGWVTKNLDWTTVVSVVIPECVTSIESCAFQDCSVLQSVDIAESVTSIGGYAFQGCASLQSVVIPGGVTSIGSCAFQDCSALQSVVIPGGVRTIGGSAFSRCIALQSVVIPECVTTIEYCAFLGCSALQWVVIPDSVTRIGRYAFHGCSALQSVVIPGSVTSIRWYAFEGCSALQSVVIPGSVTSIEMYAFEGCSALQSVVIPDSVTSIERHAFEGCSALQSVVIQGRVTSIGEEAFSGCQNLRYMLAPAGLDLARAMIPDTAQVIPYGPAIMQLPLRARMVEVMVWYNKIVDECELDTVEDKLKLQSQLKSLFFSKELILKPALRQLALLSRVKVLSEGGKLITGELLQRVHEHINGNYKAMRRGEKDRSNPVQARRSLASLFSVLCKQGNVPRGPVSDIMSFVCPELSFLMGGEGPDFTMEEAEVGGGATKPS
jgi:hypothetical protein